MGRPLESSRPTAQPKLIDERDNFGFLPVNTALGPFDANLPTSPASLDGCRDEGILPDASEQRLVLQIAFPRFGRFMTIDVNIIPTASLAWRGGPQEWSGIRATSIDRFESSLARGSVIMFRDTDDFATFVDEVAFVTYATGF